MLNCRLDEAEEYTKEERNAKEPDASRVLLIINECPREPPNVISLTTLLSSHLQQLRSHPIAPYRRPTIMLLHSLPLNAITHILLYLLALVISIHPQPFVHAVIPAAPTNMGIYTSAFDDGKALYVLYSDSTDVSSTNLSSSKAYVIDLSVNWNASSPVTTRLTNGPPGPLLLGALLPYMGGWMVLSNGTPFTYNFTSNIWVSGGSRTGISGTLGLYAIADPETGVVYVPNALYITPFQANMLTIIRGYYGTTAMSLPTTQLYNYALAWSTSLHSMIMHGGATGQMFSFDPEMGWGNLNTTGDIPAPRTNACLVAAYNGTKVILFGGYNTTKTVALNDIYILDIPTLTWTRGPAAHPSNARGGAACAASNDYFIATGGFSYSAMLNATIVYNIKTASWTSAYLPVPPPPTPSPSTSSSLTSTSTSTSSTSSSTSTLSASVTTTTPTPTSSTSGGGSHIITILGTFTGVFAAVFVAAGAVIYRKRTMNSNSPIDFDNNPPILANNHHTGSNNYPLSSMNSSGRLPDPPGGQPDLSYYTDNLISGHPFNPTQSSSYHSNEPFSPPQPSYHSNEPFNRRQPSYRSKEPFSSPQPSYHSNEPFSPPQPSYHSNEPFSPPQPSYHPNENFSFRSYSPAYPPPPPPPVVMNAYWAAPPVPEIKPLRNPAAIVAKENYVYPPRKYSVSSSGMAIEHKTVLGGLREPGSAQGDGNMESLATKKKLGSIQGGPHGSRRSTQHPHTYQETCKNDGEEQQDDILDAYQDHYYAKPNSRDPQTFQNYDEPHKVPYQ